MSFQSAIVGQFRRPAGPLGSLAGWVMAGRASNRERNRWTLSLLNIGDGDRVLELGFGPGVAIDLAATAAGPTGRVVGIDHSRVMLAQARRRNRASIALGRVDLRLLDLEDDLDELVGPFDKAFSSNVLQFSKNKASVLASTFRLMRPGGRLATTFQPRQSGASVRDSRAFGEDIARILGEVGFVNARIYTLNLEPVPAVCVTAERPASQVASLAS